MCEMRARLIYSKRGGACFVPHIALAQIFSRSALRSGLKLIMTQGFSPRAKISFAPELPAGVVALNEPVDMYFHDDNFAAMNESHSEILSSHDNLASINSESYSEGLSVSHNHFASVNSESRSEGLSSHDNLALMNESRSEGLNASHALTSDYIAMLMNASLPEGFHVSRVLFPDENSPSLGKMCKYAEYLIRTTAGHDLHEHVKNFYGSSLLRTKHKDTWLSAIISEPAQNPIGGLVKYLKAENIIAGWHEMNIVRISIGGYDTEGDCVCLK